MEVAVEMVVDSWVLVEVTVDTVKEVLVDVTVLRVVDNEVEVDNWVLVEMAVDVATEVVVDTLVLVAVVDLIIVAV